MFTIAVNAEQVGNCGIKTVAKDMEQAPKRCSSIGKVEECPFKVPVWCTSTAHRTDVGSNPD